MSQVNVEQWEMWKVMARAREYAKKRRVPLGAQPPENPVPITLTLDEIFLLDRVLADAEFLASRQRYLRELEEEAAEIRRLLAKSGEAI